MLVPESLFQQSDKVKTCNVIEKKTQIQVFSCEFCKIFRNTYLAKYMRTATSEKRTKCGY